MKIKQKIIMNGVNEQLEDLLDLFQFLPLPLPLFLFLFLFLFLPLLIIYD